MRSQLTRVAAKTLFEDISLFLKLSCNFSGKVECTSRIFSAVVDAAQELTAGICDSEFAEISMSSYAKTNPNPLPNATRLHLVFRRLVVMAAICLVAATWPSSAVASCGNYLFRHGKPVDGSFSSMSHHHDAPNRETQSEMPAPPCHGPNCSGNPIPLMPVPVAPTNLVRGFDQAAILESLAQTPTPRCAIEVPTSERGACFVPSSIFRPPMV